MTTLIEARAELARLEAETEAARKLVAELEREPRSWWVVPFQGRLCIVGDYVFANKSDADLISKQEGCGAPIRLTELRPGWALVKVPTDEDVLAKWNCIPGGVTLDKLRTFLNNIGLREGGAE